MEFGGRAQNIAYQGIVSRAEEHGALLQLDPLDQSDREEYLCLSLAVSSVKFRPSTAPSSTPQAAFVCFLFFGRTRSYASL